MDNNWVENRIRPIALGRSNWLFARSLRAGKPAAAVMSLIQSARLNDHDPYRYLRDVLERLPTQPASRIGELLPHNWVRSPLRTNRRAVQDEFADRLPEECKQASSSARAFAIAEIR